MDTAAQRFAAFSSSLTIERIPEPVVESAKLHLLDALGCGLAAHALETAPAAVQAVVETGSIGPATAIGVSYGLPPADAALANGVTCHALDYDDTHTGAVAHISVAVIPAALAVAQSEGSDGADLLAAIVAGNEIVARLGMAVDTGFHARGFHATAVCGVFGATAAACRLQLLDETTVTNALGIAGSMASGLLEYLADGSSTKRLHPGWAAHSAVIASRLAAHGATGPSSVFEGRFGVYRAFTERDDVDVETITAELGERWETPRIAFKPYPACHYVHASLDAAAQALAETPVRTEDIEQIVALTPQAGVSLVLEPLADKHRPRTEYEAKFSLPYSVASLLVRGHVDVSTYTDEAIVDPDVLALASKVSYEVKDYDTYPQAFPGGVRIHTRDGRTLEAELAYQRGGPENPMTAEEIREKFQTNAALALDAADVSALEEAVMTLERSADLGAFEALARATRRERVATA